MPHIAYHYGPQPSRLFFTVCLTTVSALFILWLLAHNLQGVAIFFLPVPKWLAKAALVLFAAGLFGSALYHLALLVRRIASPQYLIVGPNEVAIPISNWHDDHQAIPFESVDKLVGPRAEKLEIRTSVESFFLEAGKFSSGVDFFRCCGQLHETCGRLVKRINNDVLQYQEIAHRFTVGRLRSYVGRVIASPEAFFLVVPKDDPRRSGMLLLFSEKLSHAVGGIFGKVACEMPLASLPDEIHDHPDWPLWEREGIVFVLPKTAVTSLRWPWWGEFELKTPEQRFTIGVSYFHQRQFRRYLRTVGWKL